MKLTNIDFFAITITLSLLMGLFSVRNQCPGLLIHFKYYNIILLLVTYFYLLQEDLSKVCAFHLDTLKCNARNQIYKFNTFDYLKIQEFEGDIHDIRNVDVNDVDYVLVNYNTCHIKLLSYTQTDFQVIDEVADFGLIDQWRFFKSNRVLYLLTIAKRACNRSLNNIWKLENNRLTVCSFDGIRIHV